MNMHYNRHTYTSCSSPSAASAIMQKHVHIAIIAKPEGKASNIDAGLTVRLCSYVYMYLCNYIYL